MYGDRNTKRCLPHIELGAACFVKGQRASGEETHYRELATNGGPENRSSVLSEVTSLSTGEEQINPSNGKMKKDCRIA